MIWIMALALMCRMLWSRRPRLVHWSQAWMSSALSHRRSWCRILTLRTPIYRLHHPHLVVGAISGTFLPMVWFLRCPWSWEWSPLRLGPRLRTWTGWHINSAALDVAHCRSLPGSACFYPPSRRLNVASGTHLMEARGDISALFRSVLLRRVALRVCSSIHALILGPLAFSQHWSMGLALVITL